MSTIEEAIGDLQSNEDNKKEAEVLCEAMKKSAKYKWLKRMAKNPERLCLLVMMSLALGSIR